MCRVFFPRGVKINKIILPNLYYNAYSNLLTLKRETSIDLFKGEKETDSLYHIGKIKFIRWGN